MKLSWPDLDAATVRAWADKTGREVGRRGPMASAVNVAYVRAQVMAAARRVGAATGRVTLAVTPGLLKRASRRRGQTDLPE